MYRDHASINDAYNAGNNIISFAGELTKEELKADEIRVSAIVYQVVIVGEATTRLSSEFRERYLDVPWKQMVGMRNILAHQYDKLDFEILWNIICIGIPNILSKIEPLIPRRVLTI
ncbi:MAG: DUF86 domain-containing protein [Phormidesmis sp.]